MKSRYAIDLIFGGLTRKMQTRESAKGDVRMKITVLGAGAMGMLIGGYLSQNNEVWLLDIDKERVEKINRDGVLVREPDGDRLFHPKAATDCRNLPEMDLLIVFVKAMYTLDVLEQNRALIGENTYLMTLQNGSGHENKLLQFTDEDHAIIGSTQHNSSIISNGYVNHGGGGKTSIGLLNGHSEVLNAIAENFTACGLECATTNEVKRQIWNKLFLNTAASSLTAVLQVPLGFIYDDPHAHDMMIKMAKEAVAVANADGCGEFDEEAIIESIETVLKNGKGGYTSIYADVKNGARTEVDTISGSVVDKAKKYGVPVPCHEMVISLIHAMENKAREKIS